jgi:hypothetical protein
MSQRCRFRTHEPQKIRPIRHPVVAAEHRMLYHRIDRDRGFESRRQAGRRLVERRFLVGEAEPSRVVSARLTVIARADPHVLSDHEHRFLLTRRVGHLATPIAGPFRTWCRRALRFRKAPFTSPSTRSRSAWLDQHSSASATSSATRWSLSWLIGTTKTGRDLAG